MNCRILLQLHCKIGTQAITLYGDPEDKLRSSAVVRLVILNFSDSPSLNWISISRIWRGKFQNIFAFEAFHFFFS